MSNLYLGNTGLRIASNSLNTTAHNITNSDTDGYTRQQVSLSTSPYITLSKDAAISYKQVGLGVTYAETRQVRDYFLDVNYRKESGRSYFYETSVDALNHVEDILGESTGGETFANSMDNLWTSVQELIKDPCNEVNQNLLVTRSYEFITRANNVYKSLCDYQLNLNSTIKDGVDDINKLAHRLEDLNIAIMKIESAQIEHANDLRDERNYIIDKIASYGAVSWNENLDGYVSMQLEGTDLVKGGIVHEIGLYQNPQTQFYTVFWTQNAKYTLNADGDRIVDTDSLDDALVFDLSRPISSDLNTDIGALKAALYARGDHNATFKDVADEETYTGKGIDQSILMNVEAEFDSLIHNITTSVNEILMKAADRANEIYPDSTYLKNPDGSYMQLFQIIVGDTNVKPLEKPATPEQEAEYNKKMQEYWDSFNTSNIQINMELRQAPSMLKFRLDDGQEDRASMEALSEAFNDEKYTLNPSVTTPVNFTTFYNALVSQVSSSGSVYTIIKDAQDQTISSIDSAREQILGVNTDEELTYMIQFQNAYNAASRFINVVDEMLEHLVTSLS